MSYFSQRDDLPLLQIEDRRAADRGAEQRRVSPRQRTLLRGLIVTDSTESAKTATVRNLSPEGAKLEFASVEDIVRSGVLLVPTRQAAWRFLTVWVDAPFSGVAFSGPIDLAADKRLAAILANAAP